MTQDEFNKAPLLDQILYDETGMLVENHPSIAEAMEKYHQAKLKLLGIGYIPRQSEKLKCHHQYMNAGTSQGEAMKKCLKCGNYIKAI